MFRRVLFVAVLILPLSAYSCGDEFAENVAFLARRTGAPADDVRRALDEAASRTGASSETLASQWRAEPPPPGAVATFRDELAQLADVHGIRRDVLKAAVCEAAAKLLIEDKRPTVNDVEEAIFKSLLQRLPVVGREYKAQEAADDTTKAIFGENTNYGFDYATDLQLTLLKVRYC